MAIIISENFDGVTAPSLPADIATAVQAGQSITSSASHYLSLPNSLTSTTVTPGNKAYLTTSDSNSGNCYVSGYIYYPGVQGAVNQGIGGVVINVGTPAVWNAVGDNSYFASVNGYWDGVAAPGFQLYKTHGSGTNATIAIVPIQSSQYITNGIWYFIVLQRNGALLQAGCQRKSDGKWLTNSAAWQSIPTMAIRYIDPSPLAQSASYGGFFFFDLGTNTTFADNLSFGNAPWTGSAPAVVPDSDPTNIGGWSLVANLSDEFSGASVDATKWYNPGLAWWTNQGNTAGSALINTDQANNVGLSSGSSTETGGNYVCTSSYGAPNYTSGWIQTKNNFTYGYIEFRMKAPATIPLNSACWLQTPSLPTSGGVPASQSFVELDIVEITPALGSGSAGGIVANKVYMTPHVWQYPGHPFNNQVDYISVQGSVALGSDPSANFHTYGLLWSSTTITWFVDGVYSFQITGVNAAYFNGPMTVLANSGPAFSFFGNPGTTGFPVNTLYDYVRVWQSSTVGGGSDLRRRRR